MILFAVILLGWLALFVGKLICESFDLLSHRRDAWSLLKNSLIILVTGLLALFYSVWFRY